MQKVIDAEVADGLKELLAERALATDDLADADIAQLRAADGRGARPAPAAPLHRGRVPSGVHAAGRADPPARAGPLRDHARPGAAARPIGHEARSPPATTASRSTSSTSSSTTRAPAPSCSRPGHPLHDAVTDEADRALAARRSTRGTVLVSPTLRGAAPARRRHRGDRRRHRDSGRAPLRLRVHRRARRVEAAGPAPYLDCVAAPLTSDVDRGPRAAVARRGRGARGELDHRQPAPGLPQRGQAAPRAPSCTECATRSSAGWTRRATGSSSRRWSPRSRSRPARSPRRATRQPDAQGGRPRGAGAPRGSRCSTASCRCKPSRRGSSPPRSSCRWRLVEAEIPGRRADARRRRRRRSSAAASTLVLATERALGRDAGRAGVQQPRLRRPVHSATARIRSGSRSRPASPAPRTSSSPTTRC